MNISYTHFYTFKFYTKCILSCFNITQGEYNAVHLIFQWNICLCYKKLYNHKWFITLDHSERYRYFNATVFPSPLKTCCRCIKTLENIFSENIYFASKIWIRQIIDDVNFNIQTKFKFVINLWTLPWIFTYEGHEYQWQMTRIWQISSIFK